MRLCVAVLSVLPVPPSLPLALARRPLPFRPPPPRLPALTCPNRLHFQQKRIYT